MSVVGGGRAARFAARVVLVAGVVAGVAALGSGLSGCVGDPGPIVTETPVPTSVPSAGTASPGSGVSPSPSVVALSDVEVLALMPEFAARGDLLGAMATAQFFLEQYAPMFHTGDTRVWEALSAPGCAYCASALESAVQVRDEGWTATGGEIAIDEARTRGTIDEVDEAVVSLVTTVESEELTSPSGEVTHPAKRRDLEFGLVLAFDGARWTVTRVVVRDA